MKVFLIKTWGFYKKRFHRKKKEVILLIAYHIGIKMIFISLNYQKIHFEIQLQK